MWSFFITESVNVRLKLTSYTTFHMHAQLVDWDVFINYFHSYVGTEQFRTFNNYVLFFRICNAIIICIIFWFARRFIVGGKHVKILIL